YYRVYANNHSDFYSSFTVKVLPADISVKLKHFEQEFHSDLLDSANIFKKMLDESTPNILDAESFDETKAYLQDILSFVILKNDAAGYFDPAVDKPNAGYYTIGCQKSDEWAKRIGKITLVGSSNAYQITPIYFDVVWTENTNKWYDNANGHRPTAKIAEDMNTFGQTIKLTSVDVAGDKGTPLDDSGDAVNAGAYTAKVSSTNSNFAVANSTYEFTIHPRKITVQIVDKEVEYAFHGDVTAQKTKYTDSTLKDNLNNEGYIATLDPEIVAATGQSNALVHSKEDYKKVFTVDINATTTPDGKYYKVGNHTLDLKPQNSNYEITAINGRFTVTEAKISVTIEQLKPKVFEDEAQDITLKLTPGEGGNIKLSGYELENFDECVKIQYRASMETGDWSDTPLTITNVIESPKTVYYKVSAPNHSDHTGSFTQELRAVNIMVYFDGQKDTVYYGSEIPTSDQLLTICNAKFTVEEQLVDVGGGIASEALKDIHPSAIFEFYLLHPETGQAVVNRNADARSYTVTHRMKANVSKDIRNYNVVYHRDESTDERDNVNVYTISPKPLNVIWEQKGDGWTGEGKDRYIFSNTIPTVFPTPDERDVVEGDSIYLASEELDDSIVGSYVFTTKLTTERNKNNYTLRLTAEDGSTYDEHTFYIDPLEVKIVIKDQYAKYGQASQVPLGELIDPTRVGAIWDYAQGSSARFYSVHYSYWKFISEAHSSDGSLVDVNEDGYAIILS
ncbi:MAG: hypothetical protein K2L53_04795, partial [Clostridia bacterium]|nr:hypothetical protein [Clostridia bacterium]